MLTSRTHLSTLLALAGLLFVWPETDVWGQRTRSSGSGVGTATTLSPSTTGGQATGTTAGRAGSATPGGTSSTRTGGAAGNARTGAGGGGFGESSALDLEGGTNATQPFGPGMVGRNDARDGFIGNQGAGAIGAAPFAPNAQFGGRGGNGFGGNGFGGNGGRGIGNLGGRGIGNLGGQGRRNGLGGTSTSLGEFRPQIRIAVQTAPRPLAAVRQSLRTSVARLQQSYPNLRDIDIDINDGGTVTLRGSVSSDSTKRLTVLMMKMEPGVQEVNDELTVRPDAPPYVE